MKWHFQLFSIQQHKGYSSLDILELSSKYFRSTSSFPRTTTHPNWRLELVDLWTLFMGVFKPVSTHGLWLAKNGPLRPPWKDILKFRVKGRLVKWLTASGLSENFVYLIRHENLSPLLMGFWIKNHHIYEFSSQNYFLMEFTVS